MFRQLRGIRETRGTRAPVKTPESGPGASRSGPPLRAESLLNMQRMVGNAGVRRLVGGASSERGAGRNVRPAAAPQAGAVIQGKFVYSHETRLFTDEDTGYEYELLGSISYGMSGKEAYQLGRNDDVILVDKLTKERVSEEEIASTPYLGGFNYGIGGMSGGIEDKREENNGDQIDWKKPERKEKKIFGGKGNIEEKKSTGERKKKRLFSELDNDDSDFEASDDDDRTELDDKQQMRILMNKGALKRRRLENGKLTIIDGKFMMHDPRSRKALIVHRQSPTSNQSLMENQEYFQIGDQTLRLGDGKGYYIQAGGNERDGGMKEPPPDYQLLFQQMKTMGKDKNAGKLYKMVTGKEWESKETFKDAEIAAIALYYMNNDASVIAKQLGARSQLLEHLGKLTGISGMSEFARSMEAMDGKKEAPYDGTLLVKQGLMSVILGTKTLQKIFFQGKGGEDSIFMGAPSEKNSSDGVGGAEVLRAPLEKRHEQRLHRQMSIFPKNKGAFKRSLNDLKSKTVFKLPSLTEEDIKKQEKSVAREKVTAAEALLQNIRDLAFPERTEDYNTFLNEPGGAIKQYEKKIKAMEKVAKGNKAALRKLREAKKALVEKQNQALEQL